jgi:hypothetical protein
LGALSSSRDGVSENEVREVGGGKYVEGKNLGQRKGLKNPWAGEEDVFFIHPQNGLNGFILN